MTTLIYERHLDPADVVIAWGNALIDGLIPVHDRITIEADLASVCSRYPEWTAVFFAGVLSDLVGTLPEDDRWAMMSARVVDVAEGLDLIRGTTPRPPSATGAVLADGTPFGRQRLAVSERPEADLTYAALASGISKEAAAVIAFAADGFVVARRAIELLYRCERLNARVTRPGCTDEHTLDSIAGEEMCSILLAAVRWAAHRRRVVRDYQPEGRNTSGTDEFPRHSCMTWSRRTDLIMQGPLPDSEIDEIIADLTAWMLHSPVTDLET